MTSNCTISKCDRNQHSSGLCDMHYQRKARTGDPLGVSGLAAARIVAAQGKGLGKIRCLICNQPVRDHEMKPCPEAGVSTFMYGDGIKPDSIRRRAYRRRRRG